MSSNAGTSNYVYVQSEEYSWVPARVIEWKEKEAVVSIPQYKDEDAIQSDGGKHAKGEVSQTIKLNSYPGKTLPLQNVTEEGMLKEVEDMVDLAFLHEPAILYNLKARHHQGKPYTRTGDIVIALNPYQWIMELYSEHTRNIYANALVWNVDSEGDPRSHVEPHVYETSSLAYRGLAVEGQDQSILVSGESGAGKTETVKILMRHLASVQAAGDTMGSEYAQSTSPIVQRVLDSNPLLEAFGNAKTVRNDNSSRFGKYLQLQFDNEDINHAAYSGKAIPSCVLAGSKCEVYLLEKSRVVGHEDEERTYHIFYQLLAAPVEEKAAIWKGLEDTDNESFLYVSFTDTDTIEGKSDAERYHLTKDALALIDVRGERFISLMRAICIVLQLGNQIFEVDPLDDERSLIKSTEQLEALSELMGVDKETITKSLTERTVRARNEEFTVPLKPDTASDSRDALAKEIYAKTFLWLVRTINDATCAEWNYEGERKSNFGLIGLLDIFGFESFAVNRFEQLCINYCNEKLQQKFTQDTFRSVQAEYEYEGIELGEIQYEDNADVLDLIEGRMGLVAILNEECVRPKGSDAAFVSKVQAVNKESDALIAEKGFRNYEFGIKHYAGRVKYDANNFVTKNMDTLPGDLLQCAKKSSNDIVSKELENESMINEHGNSGRPKKAPINPKKPPVRRTSSTKLVHQTVFTKFRSQLSSLMSLLGETRTRYIRCIKPNTLKQPRAMNQISTVEQLRCAGVVAAVTISRSAFPNRLEHELVLDRFKSLWAIGDEHAHLSGDPAEAKKKDVERMLSLALKALETENNGVVVRAFVIGKTRAYFRAGALEHLEAERLKGLSTWATEIQRVIRSFVCRAKFLRQRTAAIKACSKIRQFLQRLKFVHARKACVTIQCWARCVEASALLVRVRLNNRATKIQNMWRCYVARVAFQSNRNAAIVIQRIARGAIQRPRFRKDLEEKREEAKLENQLKALQRKLEEAEEKRLEAERRAAEKPKEVIVVREDTGEETRSSTTSPQIRLTANAVESGSVTPTIGQLTAQQQTLMDESGKMLEYLRKEVFKLRSQNAQLRTDFDLLKENNQRLMDANASAGASFAALNQHAKHLNKTNAKLTAEVTHYKQQIQKTNLAQAEVKEELKMKQATYIAEVHARLQYQKTLTKIVDIIQDRCRDTRLVEDVLQLSDECEEIYMNGPTGLNSGFLSSLTTPRAEQSDGQSSIVGRFKSFFS